MFLSVLIRPIGAAAGLCTAACDRYPRLCRRTRFFKFAAVGASGAVVNLGTMALLICFTGLKDWRASAISTFVAIINNYVLNNAWTFGDRRRRGLNLVTGYFCYLFMSAAGFAATTVVYVAMTALSRRLYSPYSEQGPVLIIAQLIAIAFGTYTNYALNKTLTWRQPQSAPGGCANGSTKRAAQTS